MKRYFIITELFLIAVLFAISMIINNTVFLYDTQTYWELSKSFWNPEFSFLNYPESIRGYFFPFILGLCNHLGIILGNEYVLYRLLYSALYVVGLTVIVPKLFNVNIGTKRWCIGSSIATAVFALFWYQLLVYPLSDMVAFIFYSCCLLCLKCVYNCKGKCQRAYLKCGVYSLLGGCFGYAAYNTRTVYQIPLFLSVLILILFALIKKQWKKIMPFIMLFILGIFVIAMPQRQINKNLYNQSSIKVITEGYGEGNLFVSQLYWGIGIPRYETYIGAGEYPSPSVRYTNQIGNHIVETNRVESITDFIVCIMKHPLEAFGIYFEHLISGVTLFRNQVYLTNMKIRIPIYVINCFIFIFSIIFIMSTKWRWKDSGAIAFILLAVPAIISLPGATETRFFLPLYIIVYVYLSIMVDYKKIWINIKKRWFRTPSAVG